MKLSLRYNLSVTIGMLFIGYLTGILRPKPVTTILMFGREVSDPYYLIVLLLALCVTIIYAEMLLLRSLWNNVIVNVTNAKEIDLSQAYALTIFMGMIVVGL